MNVLKIPKPFKALIYFMARLLTSSSLNTLYYKAPALAPKSIIIYGPYSFSSCGVGQVINRQAGGKFFNLSLYTFTIRKDHFRLNNIYTPA